MGKCSFGRGKNRVCVKLLVARFGTIEKEVYDSEKPEYAQVGKISPTVEWGSFTSTGSIVGTEPKTDGTVSDIDWKTSCLQ